MTKALRDLIDASKKAYLSEPDDRSVDADDEDISSPASGITFGMIRRADSELQAFEWLKNLQGFPNAELTLFKLLIERDRKMAEALDCFWNAAIGHVHDELGSHDIRATVSAIAVGLRAVAERMRRET